MKPLTTLLLIAATATAAEPKAHRDLPYTEPKNERQTLDVYSPTRGKNLPVKEIVPNKLIPKLKPLQPQPTTASLQDHR